MNGPCFVAAGRDSGSAGCTSVSAAPTSPRCSAGPCLSRPTLLLLNDSMMTLDRRSPTAPPSPAVSEIPADDGEPAATLEGAECDTPARIVGLCPSQQHQLLRQPLLDPSSHITPPPARAPPPSDDALHLTTITRPTRRPRRGKRLRPRLLRGAFGSDVSGSSSAGSDADGRGYVLLDPDSPAHPSRLHFTPPPPPELPLFAGRAAEQPLLDRAYLGVLLPRPPPHARHQPLELAPQPPHPHHHRSSRYGDRVWRAQRVRRQWPTEQRPSAPSVLAEGMRLGSSIPDDDTEEGGGAESDIAAALDRLTVWRAQSSSTADDEPAPVAQGRRRFSNFDDFF